VTKDQKRIAEFFLPLLTERTYSDKSESAGLDATILNRAMLQGPDPLFLMETCPEQFARLCGVFKVDEAVGRDAIMKAHEQGPAVLLQGGGLPLWPENDDDLETDPATIAFWKIEALWLTLAVISDCTEGGYAPEVTLLTRFRRATAVATKLEGLLCSYTTRNDNGENGKNPDDVLPGAHALRKLVDMRIVGTVRDFIATTKFTFDERGFPHTDVDHGFYVAYKEGHKVCAVKQGGLTFWGTVPETSLEAQGIVVDKVLSPTFGIVFPKEAK
jgi:hypothetical protein